jgi:hypothetical protein
LNYKNIYKIINLFTNNMCSINDDSKTIYIHVPKNGGLYVEHILKDIMVLNLIML